MEFENNCAQQPDHETRHAIKEISRNGTTDAYFKARAPLIDTLQNRRTFEAGFDRGWNAALRNEPEAPIRTVKPQNEEEGNSASEGFDVEFRAPEHPAISLTDKEAREIMHTAMEICRPKYPGTTNEVDFWPEFCRQIVAAAQERAKVGQITPKAEQS